MLFLLILSMLNLSTASPESSPESYQINELARFIFTHKGVRSTFGTMTWSGKIVFMGTSVGKFNRTYFLLDGELVRGKWVFGWKNYNEVVIQWIRRGKLYRTEIKRDQNGYPITVCVGPAERA